MSRLRYKLCCVLYLAFFSLTTVANGQSTDEIRTKFPGDWVTAAPSDVLMDANLLREMTAKINGPSVGYQNIKSLLLVKDGKLVTEDYFPRHDGDQWKQALMRVSPQELTSATKSITSLLIGIAIDKKLIKSADEKVATFFPEYADIFSDSAKANIRLRDLLTMQAGLSWDEWT